MCYGGLVTGLFKKLKLRWKLLALVLPLIIVPVFIVAAMIGYIANHQAYLGVTQTSKADLQHMASFTIDLLDSHHQHYLKGDGEQRHANSGEFESEAFAALKNKIKSKKVGDTGYIFCIDGSGTLTIHPDAEGTNILDARDSSGFPFVREMWTGRAAGSATPGRTSAARPRA